MPRGKKKLKLNKKSHLLQVILFVFIFIIIKIGQIPLLIVNSPLLIVKRLFTLFKLPITYYLLSIKPNRGRPKKFLNRFSRAAKVGFVFTVILIIALSYAYFTFKLAYQLPHPERLSISLKPLTSEFYDKNGTLLYRFYGDKNRSLVKLEDLPEDLINATIAIEDKNFYHHLGFDIVPILRAFYHNIRYGRQEGASTITQQLIKNTLLTPEKTYSRKIKEIFLAFWAERTYSKQEILQMYFNETPYGGIAWGVEAASQTYFGKSAKDLNLSESAFLAGLPASPTQYLPYGTNFQLAKIRQIEVLEKMVSAGYITHQQKELAQNTSLDIKPPQNNIKAPHFVMFVKDVLSKKYGPRLVSQGGLKVYTTLDLKIQQQTEEIVKDEVNKLAAMNVRNGAAMVIDAKTGTILAMVGSKDFKNKEFGNFNATLSLRQPGSSIKPITYATAFKMGFTPANTILDAPVSFKDIWGNSYSPVNYDGRFHGPVSLRVALASSYNVPAVKLLNQVGIDQMIQTAKDLGITSFEDKSRFGLSLTLGGGEVPMIEMMGVYQAFSQTGRLNKPTGILKVTDAQGDILEEYEDTAKQVLDPQVAYLVTNILSDNRARTPAFGPSSLLNIPPYVVAVKTGTSDNKRDNWTFGYTERFVVGVWVGNNNNSPMHPALTSGVTGAAPIWNKIMVSLLAEKPSLGFKKPAGVVETSIDGRKDLSVAGTIPKSLVRKRYEDDEHSSTGYKTVFFDAFSTYATSSAQAAIKDGATN